MFLPLIKADEEKRLIYARAAAEEPDKAREILDYLSAKPAFETWSKQYVDATMGKSAGNLRVMHNPRHVAGKIQKIIYNDGLKAIDVVAKVIDPVDWQKVEEGAYTGLSIGGGYARKWADGASGCTRYTPRIQEISLVDAPCIPSARIMEMQKRDGSTEEVLLKGVPRTFSQMLPPQTFDDLHKAKEKTHGLHETRGKAFGAGFGAAAGMFGGPPGMLLGGVGGHHLGRATGRAIGRYRGGDKQIGSRHAAKEARRAANIGLGLGAATALGGGIAAHQYIRRQRSLRLVPEGTTESPGRRKYYEAFGQQRREQKIAAAEAELRQTRAALGRAQGRGEFAGRITPQRGPVKQALHRFGERARGLIGRARPAAGATIVHFRKQESSGPDLVLDQPRVIRRRGHQPYGKGPMQPMRATMAAKQEPGMDELELRRAQHANKQELLGNLRKARLVDGVFNPTRNMRSSQQQPGRTAVVGDRPAGVAYAVSRYQPQLDELAFRLRAAANRERDQQGIGREQIAEIAYDGDPDVPLDHERDLPRRRKRNAKKLELIERLRKQGMLLQPDNSIGQWQAQHSDQWGPPPVGGPGLFGQKKPIVIQNVGLGGSAAQNYGPGGFGLAEPMGDMAKVNWSRLGRRALNVVAPRQYRWRRLSVKESAERPAALANVGPRHPEHPDDRRWVLERKRMLRGRGIKPAQFAEPMGDMAKQRYPKSPEAKSKIQQVMHEWKHGQLRSWRSNKPKHKMPVVRNQKQAVAIALSQARRVGKAEDSDFVARLAGEHMEKALYGGDAPEKVAFQLPRRAARKSADEEFLDLAKRCGADEPMEKWLPEMAIGAAPALTASYAGRYVGGHIGERMGARLGAIRATMKAPVHGSPLQHRLHEMHAQHMIARHAKAGRVIGRVTGGTAGAVAGVAGGVHAIGAYERGKAERTREQHREAMKAEPLGPLLKALTGPPIDHDGHHHHQALTGPSVGTNGGHTHLPAHVERSEHGEGEEHRHAQHEDPGDRLREAHDRWHREGHVDLDAFHAQLLHHANRALLGRANKVASTHKQIAETWHHVATAQEAYDKMRPHVPEGHHVMMEVPHVGGLVYNPEGIGPDHFDNRGRPSHVIYMMHPHEVDDWIKKHGQHAEKRAPDFPGRILHFDDLEKQLTRVGEALVTGARKLGSHMISAAPKVAAGMAGGAAIGGGIGAGVGAVRTPRDPKTGRIRTRGQQIWASAKRGAAIGANLGGLGAAI